MNRRCPRLRIIWALALTANCLQAGIALGGGTIAQHFPADKPVAAKQTGWRIVWDITNHAGGSEVLVIKEAWFQRSPAEPELKILGDSRLAEIFVPYNGGRRIYDISNYRFPLVDLDASGLGPACVAAGVIYDRAGAPARLGPIQATHL
ncbi:MAG: hypothetical protein ACKV0T_15385 [Planctomycetales bacterium]